MDIITLLQVLIGCIFGVMVLLALVYLKLMMPKKKKVEETSTQIEYSETIEKQEKKSDNYGRFQGELTQESIFQFMEFDEIVDDMIVRKNKTQYVMVLQCNGVNYDLMSEQEKISVEEGFVQFLNTLRFPIQLYVQSRTLNLKEIIADYRARVNSLNDDLTKLEAKIEQARRANNKPLQEKLYFEKRRKQSVLDYGVDITNYVERLNSNQNILQQKTYVIVSFFINELGTNMSNYSKDEIDNMCFSELYTRCQNVASALATSQVTSKILSSEELMELLYIAYNRDESEVYQLQRALDAQYDALYSSGKDVLEKKQEKLDKEINIAAIDLATDSILRADKQKQIEDLEKQKNKTNAIKDQASKLLSQYENQLNPRVYELAQENIEKGPIEDEEDEDEEVIEKPKAVATKKVVKKVPSSSQAKKVGTASVAKKVTTTQAKSETERPTSKTAVRKKVVKKPTDED